MFSASNSVISTSKISAAIFLASAAAHSVSTEMQFFSPPKIPQPDKKSYTKPEGIPVLTRIEIIAKPKTPYFLTLKDKALEVLNEYAPGHPKETLNN